MYLANRFFIPIFRKVLLRELERSIECSNVLIYLHRLVSWVIKLMQITNRELSRAHLDHIVLRSSLLVIAN